MSQETTLNPTARKQFFFSVRGSGEPRFHCGSEDDLAEVATVVSVHLRAELEEMFAEGKSRIDFSISTLSMTPEEVAAIPEH